MGGCLSLILLALVLDEFKAGRLGVGLVGMRDLRVSGVLEGLSVDVVGVVLG